MQNFIDCIGSRQPPVCDVEIGHRAASVCHLGVMALRLGRKLQWDPAKEAFVGDAEADTLDQPRDAQGLRIRVPALRRRSG